MVLNGLSVNEIYYGENVAHSSTYQLWRYSGAGVLALNDIHSTISEVTIELNSIHFITDISITSSDQAWQRE